MTRDSKAWPIAMWCGLVVAVATYMATTPPIAQWTWQQWWLTLAGVAMVAGAKFGNSPLLGENDVKKSENEKSLT